MVSTHGRWVAGLGGAVVLGHDVVILEALDLSSKSSVIWMTCMSAHKL